MDNELSHLYEKDDLADYANVEAVNGRGSGCRLPSRSDLLEMALDVEPTTVCSGGYQGTYLFIVVVNDTLWLIKDSYGSCSYCDGLLAQEVRTYSVEDEVTRKTMFGEEVVHSEEDENLQQYARSMMNNAYAFESKNDAVRFLHEKDDDRMYSHGWAAVAEDGISELSEVDY